MDLGKISRDAEDRSVAWAAAVTALLGLAQLLGAGASHLEDDVLGARTHIVAAVVFFGLAYGVYRGSRVAAVAVVTLYVLLALLSFLLFGFGGVGLMTIVLGVVLWTGMRGVFAQAERPPRPRRSP